MGLTIQGDGQSSLSIEAERPVISLPRQVFGQGWGDLASRIFHCALYDFRQRVAFAPIPLQ